MGVGAAAASSTRNRPVLAVILSVVFLVAMLMGAGPGVWLINPDPADPAARFTVFGVPIIYAWGLLWYAVQLAVVIVAYFKVWRDDDDAAADGCGV